VPSPAAGRITNTRINIGVYQLVGRVAKTLIAKRRVAGKADGKIRILPPWDAILPIDPLSEYLTKMKYSSI
jgi:hypothetical protein